MIWLVNFTLHLHQRTLHKKSQHDLACLIYTEEFRLLFWVIFHSHFVTGLSETPKVCFLKLIYQTRAELFIFLKKKKEFRLLCNSSNYGSKFRAGILHCSNFRLFSLLLLFFFFFVCVCSCRSALLFQTDSLGV